MANSLTTLSYVTTNVTTSAYTTLIASTTIPTIQLQMTDTSGQVMKIAVGSAGNEVDLFQLPVNRTVVFQLPSITTVPVGSRLSIKAVSGTANFGTVAVTLLS